MLGAVLGTQSPTVNEMCEEPAILSCCQSELREFASSREEGHSRQREQHVCRPEDVPVCMGMDGCLRHSARIWWLGAVGEWGLPF